MTPESLTPSHPKVDRVTPKEKRPVGYILMLNKQVVPEVGQGGVIKSRDVAEQLRSAFIEARPELKVELFGVFPVSS